MPTKPKPHPGCRGDPVSAAPLTPDQLVRGVLQISKAEAQGIAHSKPGLSVGGSEL
jgi:hypothetical protein